jgi:hypothetical protein
LSANRDRDWLQDLDDASVWVEDYWRVIQESQDAAVPGPDRILEAAQGALDVAEPGPEDTPAPAAADPAWPALAVAVSLPPGFMEAAGSQGGTTGPVERLLADDGVPVRLAVYAKLLGPDDESYPDGWRDPATGELPTMQQLAGLAGVSLPTLRKRRDAAIARLEAALGRSAASEGREEVDANG